MMSVFDQTDMVSKGDEAHYAPNQVQKFQRVALAGFLSGLAACLLVALIAAVIIGIYSAGSSVLNGGSNNFLGNDGFMGGATLAVFASAFNWFVGYLTIPAAWLALALSLGRFPYRGIVHRGPYLRWGAIWGAILVGGTPGTVAALIGLDSFSRDSVAFFLGALTTGCLIGALAGIFCGWIFFAVLRPQQQLRTHQVDVF